MSMGRMCEHGRWLSGMGCGVGTRIDTGNATKRAVVTQRRANRSAFNGYHETPSDYSEVMCLECGARWRTRAKYVSCLRDATDEEAMYAHHGKAAGPQSGAET
jgi:hypothetical protein